jgi:hypothetical protein
MDAATFIRHSLTQAHERFLATLRGLDEDVLVWRPAPHANAIIEIVWHVARVDDRLGRTRAGLGPEVWSSQQWYRRFGLAEGAKNNHHGQIDFVRGLRQPGWDLPPGTAAAQR